MPVVELKSVYDIDLISADFKPYGKELVTVEKTLLRNALPDLEKASIWTAEKLEGMAVTTDGNLYIVTDNYDVDDATGETIFLDLGNLEHAFNMAEERRSYYHRHGYNHD